MKYPYFICLLFSILFWTCNCNDDDDPCINVEPRTADFVVENKVELADSIYYFAADDTVLVGRIRFRALHDLDTYAWSIGDDPRVFETKEVELLFDRTQFGTINVSLEGTWEKDVICFEEDLGMDQKTKPVTLMEVYDAAYIGRFEGYCTSNPSNIFVIEPTSRPTTTRFINNFPDGCVRDTVGDSNIRGGYRAFIMPNMENFVTCSHPKGSGEVSSDLQKIQINYQIWDSPLQEVVRDTFIGTKIQ